jgi:hypothetical protein
MIPQRYDPGQPAAIRHDGGPRFAVQSFRNPEDWYTVDREAGTCSCPDFAYRGDPSGRTRYRCKHMKALEARLPELAAAQARRMPTPALRAALSRDDVSPAARDALSRELFARARKDGATPSPNGPLGGPVPKGTRPCP